MKRTRHTPEQIVRKLREADADLANGLSVPDVCKKLGVAEPTYYRWRNQFGGLKADEMRRLKDLEKENGRLKALVADLSLDKAILQEALRGNCSARPGGARQSSGSRRPWASPSVGRAERWGSPDRPNGMPGRGPSGTRPWCNG
jgi:putative transposase